MNRFKDRLRVLENIGRRYAIAMMVAYLYLTSTAGSFWSAENRFFLHWQRSDAVGVLGAIALTGAIFLVAWSIVGSIGAAGRWFRQGAFVFIALQYARVNVAELLQAYGLFSVWLAYALRLGHFLLLVAFLVRRQRLVAGLRNVALLLSPILLVYAFTLITARTYDQMGRNYQALQQWRPEEGASATCVDQGRRVVLLVFDEWSYDRVFANEGTVNADYPEVARAAAAGMVFTEAYSPATQTLGSLPCILRGAAGRSVVAAGGNLQVEVEGALRDFKNQSTMLTDMHQKGRQAALIGNYLPYADLVGNDADLCTSFNLYRVLGDSPSALAASLCLENLRIRLSFIHPSAGWAFNLAKHRYFVRMAAHIQTMVLSLIRSPDYGLVFIHHSVPHMPFIFDRGGPRSGLHHGATLELAHYQGNLRYTDRLVGEIYDAAVASHDDEWLLILTADHSFRGDPMWKGIEEDVKRDKMRHVPLIMIQPRHPRHAVINTPFRLTSLREIIARWIDTGKLPAELTVDAVPPNAHAKGDLP